MLARLIGVTPKSKGTVGYITRGSTSFSLVAHPPLATHVSCISVSRGTKYHELLNWGGLVSLRTHSSEPIVPAISICFRDERDIDVTLRCPDRAIDVDSSNRHSPRTMPGTKPGTGRQSRKRALLPLAAAVIWFAGCVSQAAARNIYDPAISAIVPRIGSFGGGTR